MSETIASIVMAAGRGSRMKAYDGNKTLLPLIAGKTPFEGERPLLVHILEALPPGPKTVIVHFCADDVRAATAHLGLSYCFQPELNGTGGALLAAREFVMRQSDCDFIVTMGDVPFVTPETYRRLASKLAAHDMAVLGFVPKDRRQYGVLEIAGDRVARITEWKYWKDYPPDRLATLSVCNAGIYAVRREAMKRFVPVLESRPQVVHKARNGEMDPIREYFITDLVEYMNDAGLSIGYQLAADETETMGVDDPQALTRAQALYRDLNLKDLPGSPS